MRKHLNLILKEVFYTNLINTRSSLGFTQSQMANILYMDPRSYIDLDHGKCSCSALTLALFLIYCCSDKNLFFEELQEAFEKGTDTVA